MGSYSQILKYVTVLSFVAISLCNIHKRWRDSGQDFIIVALQTISETSISHTYIFTIEIDSPKSFHEITDQNYAIAVSTSSATNSIQV